MGKINEMLMQLGTMPKNMKFTERMTIFPGVEAAMVEYRGEQISFRHCPMGQIMQINLCLEGRVGWSLKNQQSIYLGPGDLSIHMMDRCAISSMVLPAMSYRGLFILVDTKRFDENLPELLRKTGFLSHKLEKKYCPNGALSVFPMIDGFRLNIRSIHRMNASCRQAYWQIKIQEFLLVLYTEPLIRMKETIDLALEKVIKSVRKKLVNDLQARPTINCLAKDFLINATTLKKVFKVIYGKSIAQYMKQYRMQVAAKLLCQSDLSVGEVAYKVGYESQSKFAANFKAAMQISPLEYRKRYRFTVIE